MTLTTEQIMADAEVAALYFRTLCDKMVPASAAVQLTGSYMISVVSARSYNEKPRDPWEGGG